MPRRRCRAITAMTLVAAVSACGTLTERRDEVAAAVIRFERALDTRSPANLCAALAPATRDDLEQAAEVPCREAITKKRLPAAGAVRHVDVYGGQARVVLEHDTVFLARFPAGWMISAAGCTPVPREPYQCKIKGR